MKPLQRLFLFAMTAVMANLTWAQSFESGLDQFDQVYQQELGSTQGCKKPQLNVFKVCSDVLRNDGNAPFILHHNTVTAKVVVLFHGLSDSPFYFKSIAKALHKQGHNVVVALLPGHGKKNADLDMQDYELSNRWRQHVAKIIQLSANLGEQTYLGGFSTGGTLATEYALNKPSAIKGLFLFSGALALDENVEWLTKVWGIQWLLKLYDGEYVSIGQNQFKYPDIARFTVVELTDLIFSVRDLIVHKRPNLAIFAAHSAADITTPIIGVKNLLATNQADSLLYEIPKQFNVCHGDLVINEEQYQEMKYELTAGELVTPCKLPAANPKHQEMLEALLAFMDSH